MILFFYEKLIDLKRLISFQDHNLSEIELNEYTTIGSNLLPFAVSFVFESLKHMSHTS